MWSFCSPIHSDILRKFEDAFNFHFNDPLRAFLLDHNSGRTRQCNLATSVKERRISCLLDFSQGGNAWDINRRMRKLLGNKCIVIGMDRSDNFLCVRRAQRNQEFIIWNHITGEIEESIMEIPETILLWQTITRKS